MSGSSRSSDALRGTDRMTSEDVLTGPLLHARSKRERITSTSTLYAEQERSGLSARLYWLLLAFSALVQIVPNWLVQYVPLADYPSHLSRGYIAAHLATDAVFQKYYSYVLLANPNSGVDVILPLLMKVASPDVAGKLFLTLVIAAYVLGSHMLLRATGRTRHLTTVAASMLAMNWMYLYGFVNYVLGVGLFFVGYACWLQWQHRWTMWRAIGVAAVFLLCYFVHLSSAAFLAAAIGVSMWLRLPRVWQVRVAWAAVAGCVAVVTAIVAGAVPGFYWGTTPAKAASLLTPFRTYSRVFDAFEALAILGIAGVVVARRKHVVVQQDLAISSLLLFVLFLIAPNALGTVGDVDVRAVPAAVGLLLVAIGFTERDRVLRLTASSLVALLTIRIAAIAISWPDMSERIAEQVQLLDSVPEHATLYPVVTEGYMLHHAKERSLAHVTSYATIRNNVVVGDFWHNLVVERIAMPKSKFTEATTATDTQLVAAERAYEYLWCYRLPASLTAAIAANGELVGEQSGAMLFRMRRQ